MIAVTLILFDVFVTEFTFFGRTNSVGEFYIPEFSLTCPMRNDLSRIQI